MVQWIHGDDKYSQHINRDPIPRDHCIYRLELPVLDTRERTLEWCFVPPDLRIPIAVSERVMQLVDGRPSSIQIRNPPTCQFLLTALDRLSNVRVDMREGVRGVALLPPPDAECCSHHLCEQGEAREAHACTIE